MQVRALMSHILSTAAACLGTWIVRFHSRRELQRLDDRLLRDIGTTGYDAEQEACKPFWRK